MNHLLSQCKWPELPEKFDLALRAAIEFILDRYQVSGIIASGTILRGTPDPASDLDIYVIHQKNFRQRVQKLFNSTPAEIFVNPPQAIESYFEEEQSSRRPLTAHMLATGFVILNLDPVVDNLRIKAKELLSNPPPAPEDLTYQRYLAALILEDAVDILERDPDSANMIVHKAVSEMINFCFVQAGKFIPRAKSLLEELAILDIESANLARSFYQATSLDEKFEIANQFADRTIQARCFFEWEKKPEIVTK